MHKIGIVHILVAFFDPTPSTTGKNPILQISSLIQTSGHTFENDLITFENDLMAL